MTEGVFSQRVVAAGLSRWELGDLLGIHPHCLHRSTERIAGLPISLLLELARKLDMHPADLVPELDSVLANGRRIRSPAASGARDADALVVLTALAHTTGPLTVDDLATALDWSLHRVTAALGHTEDPPGLGGPVALRRTEPGTYTVTARLDQLTPDQLGRLGQAQLHRHPLTAEQAHVLLASLALSGDPQDYLDERDAHPAAERDLKRAGLLHTENGPHRPRVQPDVWFSLRYSNAPGEIG